MVWTVASFYQFFDLPDVVSFREDLLATCLRLGLKGSILLAEEGINGTVAGSAAALEDLLEVLRQDPRLTQLSAKFSVSETLPFQRLKVRIKPEIISLGMSELSPQRQRGKDVTPQDWNALLMDPSVVVVDTRNDYEVQIGTFQGAHNPQTQSFRDFPAYVRDHFNPQEHRRVAMFCTGGIRCEKASALMLHWGFREVYQLQGGILKYLEEIPPEASLWQGECFVFDERVAVTHGVLPGTHRMCFGCGWPLSLEDRQSPLYEPGVACPHCHHRLTPHQRARFAERMRQWQHSQVRQHLLSPMGRHPD